MKRSIIAGLVICTLAACNSNETKTAENATTDTSAVADNNDTSNAAMHNCYGYTTATDTVNLHIMAMGTTVTGDAVFQYAGKDKNTGTLSGEMKGDTLIANYKFMSEGKESVRQVAFLKKGDSFSEGYGESEEKAGTMAFKNTANLKFTGKTLEKMDCNK